MEHQLHKRHASFDVSFRSPAKKLRHLAYFHRSGNRPTASPSLSLTEHVYPNAPLDITVHLYSPLCFLRHELMTHPGERMTGAPLNRCMSGTEPPPPSFFSRRLTPMFIRQPRDRFRRKSQWLELHENFSLKSHGTPAIKPLVSS